MCVAKRSELGAKNPHSLIIIVIIIASIKLTWVLCARALILIVLKWYVPKTSRQQEIPKKWGAEVRGREAERQGEREQEQKN